MAPIECLNRSQPNPPTCFVLGGLIALLTGIVLSGGCKWIGIRDPEWVFDRGWHAVLFKAKNGEVQRSIVIPIGTDADSAEFSVQARTTRPSANSAFDLCRIYCSTSLRTQSGLNVPLRVHLNAIRIAVAGQVARIDSTTYSAETVEIREWGTSASATFEVIVPLDVWEDKPKSEFATVPATFELNGALEYEGNYLSLGKIEGQIARRP